MTAPSNNDILTKFPTDLNTLLSENPNYEIWSVNSHFLVDAGVNVEQLVADLFDGKFQTNPAGFQVLKAVTPVVSFQKIAPVAGPTNSPSNATLLANFPANIDSKWAPGFELWSVTSQYLVVAGTDIQQMIVDSGEGKFVNNTPKMSPNCKGIRPVVDIVKVK